MTKFKTIAALLIVTLVTACSGPSKSTVDEGAAGAAGAGGAASSGVGAGGTGAGGAMGGDKYIRGVNQLNENPSR